MNNSGNLQDSPVFRAKTRTGPTRKHTWTRPITIALLAVGVVGGLGGGLYFALMRVPAAPPRTQQIGSVRVVLATDPRIPWTGPATVALSVSATDSSAVTDADISLTYDMQTDGIGRPMVGMGELGGYRHNIVE